MAQERLLRALSVRMAYEPARRIATALQERDTLSPNGGTVRRGIGQAKICPCLFLQPRLPISDHSQRRVARLARWDVEQEALPVRADVPSPPCRIGINTSAHFEKRLGDAHFEGSTWTNLNLHELGVRRKIVNRSSIAPPAGIGATLSGYQHCGSHGGIRERRDVDFLASRDVRGIHDPAAVRRECSVTQLESGRQVFYRLVFPFAHRQDPKVHLSWSLQTYEEQETAVPRPIQRSPLLPVLQKCFLRAGHARGFQVQAPARGGGCAPEDDLFSIGRPDGVRVAYRIGGEA